MNWISDIYNFILILFIGFFLDSPLIIVYFVQLAESINLYNRISYLLVLINLFAVDTILEMKHGPLPTELALVNVYIVLHKVFFHLFNFE